MKWLLQAYYAVDKVLPSLAAEFGFDDGKNNCRRALEIIRLSRGAPCEKKYALDFLKKKIQDTAEIMHLCGL